MASRFAPRLFLRRLRMRRRAQPISSLHEASAESAGVGGDRIFSPSGSWSPPDFHCISRVFFSARPSSLDEGKGPAAIDYPSLLPEEEFHRLADETIHELLENFEEYGDAIQIDDYEVDYGNHVLTLKLGSLGTYVVNKQTPNRQIWLSSPVSGPWRFDWDAMSNTWVYRPTCSSFWKKKLGNSAGNPSVFVDYQMDCIAAFPSTDR